MSDFRPISLTPILCKILERLVVKRWILPKLGTKVDLSQFAYIPRNGSGATSAPTLMQHKILKFLDVSSGCVRILSIDFAKAFDKVSHCGILRAVERFGLPREAVFWIASFLSERYQRVCVGNHVSRWHCVPSGVPQGSVIGPLLFCLFVADLSSICDNSVTFKYADDVTIVHFVRKNCDDRLQEELNNVLTWSSSRHLPVNESKCCVLDIITSKTFQPTPVLDLQGRVIPQVSQLRLLGVTLCHDLKWNIHVESILNKSCKRIYLIRNLKRSGCPVSELLRVYNTMIRSMILYAYPSFCNLSGYLQEKLLNFERRIFRIIGEKNSETILEAGDQFCKRLFQKVELSCDHPLRECFKLRQNFRTRSSTQLLPCSSKTVRLSKSFIRFSS